MKAKYLYIALAAVALAGCKNEIPARGDSPASEGLYIFDNTHTSVVYKPADVAIDSAVIIGRTSYLEAADYTLNITATDEGYLDVATTIHFNAGQQFDTLVVDATNMPIGASTDLTIAIADEDATLYGRSTLTINYAKDYNWASRGKVHFVSGFWNEEGDVAIEKAVEATDSLFRLVSPYFYIDPAEETEEGSGVKEGDGYAVEQGHHIKFILDANYNVVSLDGAQNGEYFVYEAFTGITSESDGEYSLYYTSKYDPDYCTFTNKGNVFTFNAFLPLADGLYGPYTEQWTWTDGCPASLQGDDTETPETEE